METVGTEARFTGAGPAAALATRMVAARADVFMLSDYEHGRW